MRAFSAFIAVASLAASLVGASPATENTTLAARSNSCGQNQFWYSTRSCCLPHGGPSKTPTPPSGSTCPGTHYWHYGQGCCVPYHPNPPPQPTCPKEWNWNSPRQCCTPNPTKPSNPTPSNYPGKKSNPYTPQPPKKPAPQPPKKSTPHYPAPQPPKKSTPHYPAPQPPKKSTPYTPQKNNHWRVKRNFEQWDVSACPAGLSTCPVFVNGLATQDTECVDTYSELTSCGGCASLKQGLDCSKIRNATLSSCQGGSCVVEQCATGFKVSQDESACVAA